MGEFEVDRVGDPEPLFRCFNEQSLDLDLALGERRLSACGPRRDRNLSLIAGRLSLGLTARMGLRLRSRLGPRLLVGLRDGLRLLLNQNTIIILSISIIDT